MTQIHEAPKPSHQAIQGQRQRTANREAATTPQVLEAQPRTNPVTAEAEPRPTLVPEQRQFQKAWNVPDR